ncbi:MAG: hypothetical protein D4R77_14560 [Planctomycetaceae bacterium]|nr:MAG: hypothetical protein D4R77_14560 [Planctomycetaceae bacterium]
MRMIRQHSFLNIYLRSIERMELYCRFCMLVVLVGVFGCGATPSPTSTEPSGPPVLKSADELTQRLQFIVDSGVTGSALGGMPEIIEKLEQRDDLMADFKKLEAATDPGQIKSIAKSMMGKL